MSWVPVEDKTPDPNTLVVGCNADSRQIDLFYYTAYGEFWSEGVCIISPEKITHWIYLPEHEC